MPPRFSYWTIIAGGLPTAFRAADREELLPTFTRLKEKQPDAEMKWFARGKLWDSPEAARQQRDRPFRDQRPGTRPRGTGSKRVGRGGGDQERETRDRNWRPGGEHRDPRQHFKDAKKARNQRMKAEKFARRSDRHELPRERPHGDPLAPERHRGPQGSRQGSPEHRKPWSDRQRDKGGFRPREGTQNRRPEQPRRDQQTRPSGPGERDRQPPASANRDRWAKRPGNKPQFRGDRTAGQQAPRHKPHGDALTHPPRGRDRGAPAFADRRQTDRRRDEVRRPPRGPSHSEGRGTFRGEGHGDNSWKPKPPRDDKSRQPGTSRHFAGPKGFDRDRFRSGGTEETPQPPRPRGPNREPRPSEEPAPSAPPRPTEPVIAPPGPPERGRLNRNKRKR